MQIIIIIINEGDTFCSDSTLYYTDALKRHGKILFLFFFSERVKEKRNTSYKIFTNLAMHSMFSHFFFG